MDRVVVGDVGYGKTEVAIRAAFKAVQDGMQVAVLVPTTLLAQQHFDTFSERMTGFPVKIEVLSRFTSKKEAKDIFKGLADGSVDIVVGTHRLLQTGVHWKNLGLIVVDEEQRFGVAHIADDHAVHRRCGLRQDRGGHPCRLQGRARRYAGGRSRAHHAAGAAAL